MKTDIMVKLVQELRSNGIIPKDNNQRPIYNFSHGYPIQLNSNGIAILNKILQSIHNESSKVGFINLKNLENYFMKECINLFSEDYIDKQTIENIIKEFSLKLNENLSVEHTVIIPITGLKVKRKFDVLDYQIISKTIFEKKYKEILKKDKIIGSLYSRHVDVGDSYAIITDFGDPNSIGNKYIEELDSALNLVRLYIPFFWHHDLEVQVSIVNEDFVTTNSFFVLDPSKLRFYSLSTNRRPLAFDIEKKCGKSDRYSQRKKMELMNYNDLNMILKSKYNLSEIIKNSLTWIGLYTKVKNNNLKFLYLVFALEAIFPQANSNNYSSITAAVSEKTAFIVASNITDRKNIFEFVKEMYKKRSAIVHGSAKSVDDDDLISLYEVYLTCITNIAKLIKKHSLKTVNELNELITGMKFS